MSDLRSECRIGLAMALAIAVAGCSSADSAAMRITRSARRIDARQQAFIEQICRLDPAWRPLLVPAAAWPAQESSSAASDAGLFRASVWVRDTASGHAARVAFDTSGIRVTGEVRRPSSLEWPEGLRLFDALDHCGGVREGADGGFVLVARPSLDRRGARLACAQAGRREGGAADPRQDLPLRAGDLVVVLRSASPADAAEEVAPLLKPLRAYLDGELPQAAFPALPSAVTERGPH